MRLILCLVAAGSVWAQSGASITGTGEHFPSPIKIAPGQILHLRLKDIATRFDSTQSARQVPLPIDFGGLQVALRQSAVDGPIPLALVRGDGWDPCSRYIPAVSDNPQQYAPCFSDHLAHYDLVVQVPYELRTNAPGPLRVEDFTKLHDAVLTVHEKGVAARSYRVLPVIDQIQVIEQCGMEAFNLYGDTVCTPMLQHADNKPVNAQQPARSGESLVLYAYGLGLPDRPVQTGAAAPMEGVPVTRAIQLQFAGLPGSPIRPDYVGLVGGQVGLYQINFKLPPIPFDLAACSPQLRSNVTMRIQGTSSSDDVSFCAQP